MSAQQWQLPIAYLSKETETNLSDAITFSCPFCRETLHAAINGDLKKEGDLKKDGDRKKILCSNCERAVEVPVEEKSEAAQPKPVAPEPEKKEESYYGITCRFCDTRLTVVPSQAGTEVKCPDCFSLVPVGPPPPELNGTLEGNSNESGGQAKLPADAGDDLSLADTFERPKVSSMYGLDPVDDDMLAPRKPVAEEVEMEELPDEEDDGLPTLDSLGTLVGGTESEEEGRPPTSKQKTKSKRKRSSKSEQDYKSPSQGRPKFEHASLFIAVVSMLTAPGVLIAAGVSMLVMVVSVCISESIYPYEGFNSRPNENQTVGKFFAAAFLGYLPYFVGLVMLWTVASFVFRDAAKGHQKVQRWTVAGQSDFLSTLLVFAFSFFIAGLPGAVLWLLIMPLRMIIAPLMLISAWFNHSPWEIVSVDWFKSTNGKAKQWTTVYIWFGGLAFVGLLAGLVFLARASTTVYVVDAFLSIFAIGLNVVITLVFAAIAGWHCGAVIENLDQED